MTYDNIPELITIPSPDGQGELEAINDIFDDTDLIHEQTPAERE